MKVCAVCECCYEDTVLSCSETGHDRLIDWRAGSCEPVANYRLERLIERDAAGDIFRAVNTVINQSYVVKIIPPEKFDDHTRRDFLRDAQAVSAVIHPNVARVFESGTLADGSLYIIAEYFAAQTLREYAENAGKPTETNAVSFARQAAEGLEAIHAAGVWHRNVHPENIILTTGADNRVLVKLQNPDFGGIAQKQAAAHAELYRDRFRYFSPEQCAAHEINAQTDVYSLGVVLYELLAGRVPFDAPYSDALIAKQINEPAPPVKINSFDIRMLLTHTLTDALQKTTLVRLKSANALARQLRHIEQLATHSSTPPPAVAYPAKMVNARIVPPAAPLPTETEQTPPATLDKTVAAPPPPAENSASIELPPPVETAPAEISDAAEKPSHEEHSDEELLAAPEAQEAAPEAQEAAPVSIDLTTTKLPPIEAVIGAKLSANTYQTQPLALAGTAREAEIPAAPRIAQVERLEPQNAPPPVARFSAAPQPATAEIVVDEDNQTFDEFGEASRAELAADSAAPLFSGYGANSSWNLTGKRKLVTGAVVVGFVMIAVFGTFLNRQIQSARSGENDLPKPATRDDRLTKTAEPVKAAEIAPPAGSSAPSSSDADETPNYAPREREEKSVNAPAAPPRFKPVAAKSPAPAKTSVGEVFDKKGNAKPANDKKTDKKQPATTTKNDVLTRPRVVKNK